MTTLYGVLAVFDTPEAVTKAAVYLRESGFRRFEAYTPYPIEPLNRIVHPGPRRFLPLLMFAFAIIGAGYGYFVQYWDEALNYPLNVGGRPYNSWPAFTVSAFEFMLLVTIAAGLFGMLVASSLPRLYHPIFASRFFARASRDRFILCVQASDPIFDPKGVEEAFGQLGAEHIEEVRT
ncbi:MAG TPA: DUF3341 domain-containing protein [Pseudolabrys sp.]|jgi:hypothetical protein|nr:DUF3341 domain-containing protein [Pseudolabrys sp.]